MNTSSRTDVMQLASDVERALLQIKPILLSFYIYDIEGNPILMSDYDTVNSYDPAIVGGLIAAINGFTGEKINTFIRLISFQNVHIFFTEAQNYLFTVVIKELYTNEDVSNKSITTFLNQFIRAFEHTYAYEQQKDNYDEFDKMCIAILRIYLLIDDELHPQHKTGANCKVDLELLEYQASKSNQEDFEQRRTAEKAKIAKLKQSVTDELTNEEAPKQRIDDPKQALDNLLTRFVEKFEYIQDLRILQPDPNLGIESIHKTKLSDEIANNVYSIILDNYSYITQLLADDSIDNVIELEDKYVVFETIAEFSFMYIVISDKEALSIIDPIIKRIASTIASMFPAIS